MRLRNQPQLPDLGDGIDVDAHNLAYLHALIVLLGTCKSSASLNTFVSGIGYSHTYKHVITSNHPNRGVLGVLNITTLILIHLKGFFYICPNKTEQI